MLVSGIFLSDILDPSGSLSDDISPALDRVEDLLLETVGDCHEIVSHLLVSGGKRARPLLVLLTSCMGSGINDAVIRAAAGIELIHLGSLYHDDVMDNAYIRHGSITAHRLWGKSAAILAGDFLFAKAGVLGLNLDKRAIAVQTEAFQRMISGQLSETLGISDSLDPLEAYIEVSRGKTGSLIAASAQVGAILGDASLSTLEPLRDFGESIGVAFQLVDDVIDLSGKSGKTPGSDIRAGVMSLPILLLSNAAKDDRDSAVLLEEIERVRRHSGACGSDDYSSEMNAVLAHLRKHDVTARTLEIARTWGDKAKHALKKLPECAPRDALLAFVETVVSREF
ncbi:MAG: polyprenyl synthetase family protein [Tropheryma whipplei]|uniref:polyprenyl synthetase family protein n=1 Tax=Tropheryma whipplei TaxID=2039 RepID=UPI000000C775|nr:polyprenyl synthetase family protein [Tropheryma whipplei]MCO8182675.1 polyprenyl synthetase family protein [Tropheryma whipplei]CAD66751.1 putative polyprenyl diphosphate synthase [Tropheryma whipplei TW08/27]